MYNLFNFFTSRKNSPLYWTVILKYLNKTIIRYRIYYICISWIHFAIIFIKQINNSFWLNDPTETIKRMNFVYFLTFDRFQIPWKSNSKICLSNIMFFMKNVCFLKIRMKFCVNLKIVNLFDNGVFQSLQIVLVLKTL